MSTDSRAEGVAATESSPIVASAVDATGASGAPRISGSRSVAAGTWLVALDIDGTIMTEGGGISDDVLAEIQRLRDAGQQIMIATGRSVDMTLPVLERLGLRSDYVVCSNGAITLGRDDTSSTGYRSVYIEEFDPREVLTTVASSLADWVRLPH